MADIHVPGVGNISKKQALLVGGGVVVVAGIAYYRHKKNQANASAATTATDPANIDPATGFAYNSPEDLAALQQQAALGTPGGVAGGIVDPNGTNVPNATTSFVDNASWLHAAVDYLSGIGEDATAVSEALGKYIAGEAVTDAEHSFITQAIAAENQPPIAGPNGYPPSIRTGAPTGQPPSPGSSNILPAPKLYVAAKSGNRATLGWAPVPHAKDYAIHSATGKAYGTASNRITVPAPGTYWMFAEPASGYKASHESNKVNV